jgi:hypothetical protein
MNFLALNLLAVYLLFALLSLYCKKCGLEGTKRRRAWEVQVDASPATAQQAAGRDRYFFQMR